MRRQEPSDRTGQDIPPYGSFEVTPVTAQLDKPGNVQTAGVLMLVGGILTTLTTLSIALIAIPYSLCLWTPVTIFGLVAGILNIVKGAQLIGNCPPGIGTPIAPPILLIINLINCDIFGPVLGIISLVMVNDHATRTWLDGHAAPALTAPSTALPLAPNPAPEVSPEPAPPTWATEPPSPVSTVGQDPVMTDDAGEDTWGESTPEAEAEAERAVEEGAWSNWGATEDNTETEAAQTAPPEPPTVAITLPEPTGEEDPLSVEPWSLDVKLPDEAE